MLKKFINFIIDLKNNAFFLNRKGVSLIILVVIITVIGILGGAIVSFVGAKQKSYPAQAQAYQALNLAHAGVEFAIRYLKDNYGQTYCKSIGSCLSGLTFNYGNGSITLSYDPATKILTSRGDVGGSRREVQVKSLAAYAFGTGILLTEILDETQSPYKDKQDTKIPITNLYDRTVYVKYMDISMGGSNNKLEDLYLGTKTPANKYYDASNDPTNPYYESKGGKQYINIPSEPNRARLPYQPYNNNWMNMPIAPGSNVEILGFQNASVKVDYVIVLYYNFSSDPTNISNLKRAELRFNI